MQGSIPSRVEQRTIATNTNQYIRTRKLFIQLSQLDGGRKQMEFVNLDLHALAQECVDMLALNAQKQNVTMQVSGKSSMIMADKQLMEELVYNLCDNAIRYNNRGGSVNVTVGQESGHTFLVVKDTGIGISKENQERVFERFYRVDKSRSKATGGTGLGLAIVKHIVSQHGAKISIESEEGKGTEIRVDFSDLAPMNN
jgi:two-component system phosphate regulon sensor histidine kinase PhoR